MELYFEQFGFYTIDKEYLKFLYSRDKQVFYQDTKVYEKKPYLGIALVLNGMKYCIPLTSAKRKHIKWNEESEEYLLIYEYIGKQEIHSNDIYKKIDENKYKKIIAVLELRKMIPIDNNLCTYIDFSKIADYRYKSLLEKEYRFIKPLRKNIVCKIDSIYSEQKKTGKIKPYFCNYSVLEKAYKDYHNK